MYNILIKCVLKVFNVIFITNLMFVVVAFAQYPELIISSPTTHFPVTFSDFTPPIDPSLILSSDSPQIFEYTRDNDAGETIIMTGNKFSVYENESFTDETTVFSCSFNDTFVATLELETKWTPDTAIEFVCSTFKTPADYNRLFFADDGIHEASIYYRNGYWYAGDGAGGIIELGTYDAKSHIFRYDSRAQIVSIDGRSFPLKGTISDPGSLYVACNSPGYQDYPMNLASCKIWQAGILVEDLVPTIDGTVQNKVTGKSYTSLTKFDLTVQAERSISYTGEYGQDSFFIAYGSGVTDRCEIVRLDGMEVAVTLPSSLPSGEMYLVWPGNAKGFGEPVAVNQTEAWWIGPDEVSAGSHFSVYGRNLGTNCHVYIEELNQWLPPEACNPYKADFIMPDIVNGTYTIWAHNGKGREYGWARPLSLRVSSEFKWTGSIIEVKGSRAVDFQTALNSSSTGDILYLPAGLYSWETFIQGFAGRAIVGDGADVTIITVDSSNTGNPGNGRLFDGLYNNVLISNLTIKVSADVHLMTARFRGVNLRFESVKFSSFDWPVTGYLPTPFVFEGAGPQLLFKNCEFLLASNPGSISIGGAKQVFFQDCDFVGAKHNSQLLVAWGTEQASISGCRAYPYNNSEDGYFDGRWFVTAAYWGAVNRIYFGENTSSNCAPPKISDYHSNTGEQILMEGGKVAARGMVSYASQNTIRLVDPDPTYSLQNVVTIVEGKGYGQTRKISGFDPDTGTIILAEPWRVVPDMTSKAVVAATTYRFAVYGNHLDGKSDWINGSEHSASTGINSYGGSVDLVVDSNKFTNLRNGIVQWSFADMFADDKHRSLQTCFFNTFINNRLEDCWHGIANIVSDDNGIMDGGILASTYRGNRLHGITTQGISFSNTTNFPVIKMSIYEDNVLNNCAGYAIEDTPHIENQLFLNNSGTNSNAGIAMLISYDHLPALKDNTWFGYAKEYQIGPSTACPPGQLLETPIRVVIVENSEATEEIYSFPIWNLGLSSLDWMASSTNEWIEIKKSFGNVENQANSDACSFSINFSTLGCATGVVEVVTQDRAQRKLVTVICNNKAEDVSSDVTITYSIAEFAGKTIRASLRDNAGVEFPLDPIIYGSDEVTIRGIDPRNWYFLTIEEYIPSEGSWRIVSSRSIGPAIRQ